MQILRGKILNHQNIYYWALILMSISLPLSLFGMSVAIIILLINCLLEGDLRSKMKRLVSQPALLLFITFYFLFILGLLHTSNFEYALHDLKIKLTLLVLPLIIGTSSPLDSKKLKNLLILFIAAVVIASIISSFILYGIVSIDINDVRNISLFISHIRFSLLINLALFILLYYVILKNKELTKWEKVIYPLVVLWLVVFIVLLKSVTGAVVLFIVGIWFGFVCVGKINHLILRIFLYVLLITIPLLAMSYFTHSITRFYTIDIVNFDDLETETEGGNKYQHYTQHDEYENGHYIWIYVCEEELRNEWNRRSTFDYDGKDKKGQFLRHTLIRYMTSRNLRKDANGIANLTEEDVKNIEGGMTNYLFSKKFSVYAKLYEIIWQVNYYIKGYNPSGHSVTQRIEYLKTGWNIVKSNFWLGVGTGDVRDAFDRQYEIDQSQLYKEYRYRAHNQFLTIWITLGFIGLVTALITLFYPAIVLGKRRILFWIFFIIALLSMINEDTLETHTGVSFFAFFYALFLYGVKYEE